MTSNDDELLNRAVLGDEDALETLLTRHAPTVRKRLDGRIDPRWQNVLSEEDVLQETWLEAFFAIRSFEPRGVSSFVAWLTMMAKRNLIDAVRELQTLKKGGDRGQVVSRGGENENSYVTLLEGLGGTLTSPTENARKDEARSLLDTALESIPEPYRLPVKLYDLGGCTAEDTAEACECGIGAMHMRRSRAHAMLRKAIADSIL